MSIQIIWLKNLHLQIVKLIYWTHNDAHFHDLMLNLPFHTGYTLCLLSVLLASLPQSFPCDLDDHHMLQLSDRSLFIFLLYLLI